MTIELRRYWSFLLAFIILSSLVIGILVLNSEKNNLKIENQQQEEKLELLYNETNALIEQLDERQQEYTKIQEELNNTRQELDQSKENVNLLESKIIDLEANQTYLRWNVELLENATKVIGVAETENLLMAYSQQAKELKKLENEYAELLQAYNNLLEQIP